jgi:nucleoside-diphosphate-sugar epimerase
VRAFVTGATGFVGGRLVGRLLERGDDVRALVRSPGRAGRLREPGCELIPGDLSSRAHLTAAMRGCDAAFHLAAIYRNGVPTSRRDELMAVNVEGTENVLDAAVDAGVGRVVHVSSIVAFGNTRGRVVDETYEPPDGPYVSLYHESKAFAHRAARERAGRGAPVVVVQPGAVYGRGDHTAAGTLLERAARGKLVLLPFGSVGVNWTYVDDAAAGILLAHDRGEVGQSYVLAGEKTTMGEIVDRVAELSGRKPPGMTMPVGMIKLASPFGRVLGPLMGFPPNMRELIKVSDGVTYWASDEKARRELGFEPRDIDTGLRQTLAA